MGISEFKAHCIRILKELQREQTPLIITHRGRPVARIEPVPVQALRLLGGLRHLGTIKADLAQCEFSDEWDMEKS